MESSDAVIRTRVLYDVLTYLLMLIIRSHRKTPCDITSYYAVLRNVTYRRATPLSLWPLRRTVWTL